MSFMIIRTTQFRKDIKRMVRRGKDDRKLEEVLRVLAEGARASR